MRRSGLRITVAASTLVALGVAAYILPLLEWTTRFVLWVRDLGVAGAIVYAGAYLAGTVLFFPGTVLTLASGFLYGPFWGLVLASPASVLGATLSFLLGRYFFREWVHSKLAQYPSFAAIDRAVEQNGFKFVLLSRLAPLFLPFVVLNYALGLTRVRLRDYVLASWIGMLPATAVYVYAGSAILDIAGLFSGVAVSSPAGRFLFWGGLAAAIVLMATLSRIAKQALRRHLETQEQPEAT